MNQFASRRTILQILFWGILWLLIPILLSSGDEFSHRFFYRTLVVFCGIAIVVWVNVEVMIQKLFFQKKQLQYFLVGGAMLLIVTFLEQWDAAPWAEYFNRPPSRVPSRPRSPGPHGSSPWRVMREIVNVLPYLTAFISSSLIEITSYANRKAKEAADFRNEKLESEMKFLKSQFNPHFLFNALNNIYTLSVIKSDKTPENLLKLSEMLRYMLYDCKAETVTLDKEITYLRHFIDLHLLKDSRGLNVEANLDESRPHMSVAPMLLLPFVENAFKHSRIEDLENGWIKISLKTGPSYLAFEVLNSLPKTQFTKDKVGGIGLENVRRQLELLYPESHQLKIEKEEDRFCVNLKLENL